MSRIKVCIWCSKLMDERGKPHDPPLSKRQREGFSDGVCTACFVAFVKPARKLHTPSAGSAERAPS